MNNYGLISIEKVTIYFYFLNKDHWKCEFGVIYLNIIKIFILLTDKVKVKPVTEAWGGINIMIIQINTLKGK